VLTNIAGVATEKADTRSWLLLPGQIQASRVELPAGEYQLVLEARDSAGRRLEQRELTVAVAPAGVTIVTWRSFE
jgi:hypothetical protein